MCPSRALQVVIVVMLQSTLCACAGKNGTRPQAFHVVAPSLPGYGFSSAPKHPGFGVNEIAKTFNSLMLKLGYKTYVAQGECAWWHFGAFACPVMHNFELGGTSRWLRACRR